MKKLISLGIASAMVATLASASFATKVSSVKLSDLQYIALDNEDNVITNKTWSSIPATGTFNGTTYSNLLQFTIDDANIKTIVFGRSGEVFGAYKEKDAPASLKVIPSANSYKAAVKIDQKNLLGTTKGCDLTSSLTKTVKTSVGNYAKAAALKITGKNNNGTTKSSVNEVTLQDNSGNQRIIHVAVTVAGFDKDDTSDAEVEVNEESGYRDFAGAAIRNGYTIGQKTLKAMKGKGKYFFKGVSGVDFVTTISKATVDQGKTDFFAEVKKDAALDERYNSEDTMSTFVLNIKSFPNETRNFNINLNNSIVRDAIGSQLCDDILEGNVKAYAYVVNKDAYDKLNEASATDGLIDTSAVTRLTLSDEVLAGNMPKDATMMLITTKELDITGLPAIPGVDASSDATGIQEITAPTLTTPETTTEAVIADSTPVIAAPITEVAPTVVSTPVLETAPAGTTAANTGATDVVTLAIALTAVLAAAAVVSSKKRAN